MLWNFFAKIFLVDVFFACFALDRKSFAANFRFFVFADGLAEEWATIFIERALVGLHGPASLFGFYARRNRARHAATKGRVELFAILVKRDVRKTSEAFSRIRFAAALFRDLCGAYRDEGGKR
jgi:hypothetical protein